MVIAYMNLHARSLMLCQYICMCRIHTHDIYGTADTLSTANAL
jgi:hypothetical protein